MDDKLIYTVTFYKIRISVAIDVNKCIFCTTYAFRHRRFYTWKSHTNLTHPGKVF